MTIYRKRNRDFGDERTYTIETYDGSQGNPSTFIVGDGTPVEIYTTDFILTETGDATKKWVCRNSVFAPTFEEVV